MFLIDRKRTRLRSWAGGLVPVFLFAQMFLIHRAASVERPPAPPAPDRFPLTFGRWKLFRSDPIEAEVAAELRADRLVSQTYIETPGNSFASLLVAWFQTQRAGARQPHSPKVCLPGGGWTPRIVDEVTVDTVAGPITVNRYVVDKNLESAVVLYWYQTSRRVIAGEWAAKFWLAADALRDKRSDTALVRVTTWPSRGGDQAATTVAAEFVRELYPRLRDYLPK
jgi:EpsI family protein